MNVNMEVCRVLSSQYGLPLQSTIKEFHVLGVAQQISMAAAPEKNLVFKGGTALNKAYLKKNQRFSEDLDFDYDTESLGEVRDYCRNIAPKIQGYEIGEFRRVKDTIQFYCLFDSPLGTRDHVRVDIAAKRVITSKPVEVRPVASEFTQQSSAGLQVYALDDLVARKLHALRTRTEGKDLFDAYHALPLCKSIGKAVQCMLKSEGEKETPREFLEKTAELVRRSDARKLMRLTNPFIPTPYRPRDWKQFRDDLVITLEQRAKESP
ncbi:nucleotidyl transferase AbiEii/AbiGii toxin family protein [Candidatus Micrarchaeota archaeon]|nr:nucleotidyl transferase AbiEii/AbiGii toxin family protein [Candidatus Micrarchaeota archaeon]MBI5176676.1 nucleotidyl transferase AbiEii/AbiGii toxin family protein [Candidatus Micrarchaeota archaeon]